MREYRIGSVMRDLRKMAGLTQQELSETFDTSDKSAKLKMVKNIHQALPSIKFLSALA